jgi:heme-degrading monooxygenase HmoA
MKYLFGVHIKPGHNAEEYADAWVRASEIIQQAPGARGTELHRKPDDPEWVVRPAE